MKLELFNFRGAEIRTVIDDKGKPWFAAVDVCRVLDIADSSSAVRICSDLQKGVHTMRTPGGMQEVLCVSEGGAYKLVFKSRKPSAEEFQLWITEEVIPSIRQTGGYQVAPALPQTFAEALRAYASEVEKREALQLENAAMKPKADFFDAVAGSEDTIPLIDVAKVIAGCPGRNTLISGLKRCGVLRANRTPYQEFIDRGYFKVTESKWVHPKTGEAHISFATRAFQTGVDYIAKLVREGKLAGKQEAA